ncbi:hypothetical protein EDD27_6280 [Nonomuraea polychroma]|uniref:Uncharacterized protein n=1 Tax=Nonomuraea polychroma TaxID=46176 RepID=A0A438MCQ9_9ACTN|nr:hypothetical protein EDD27_6280 [Nonomuraea polychroma]
MQGTTKAATETYIRALVGCLADDWCSWSRKDGTPISRPA